MQTSRDLKKKHPIRVNAVGVGVGLALVVVGGGAILNCAPGVLDKCPNPADEACLCKNYLMECGDGGGAGGTVAGNGGDNGSNGGSGGGDPPIPDCPMYEDDLGKIEAMFIVPTCGKPAAPGQDPKTVSACHNGGFAPKFDMAGMIQDDLVTPPAGTVRLTCKMDKWIDKTDWAKSYVVTKTNPGLASGLNAVMCVNSTQKGMLRMPASEDTNPSKALTPEQYECIKYYAYKLAGN
jgi:hypothetical protein